jgi:hypothetical protein
VKLIAEESSVDPDSSGGDLELRLGVISVRESRFHTVFQVSQELRLHIALGHLIWAAMSRFQRDLRVSE